MPELPEVETTLRGITPHILNKPIIGVNIRNPRLRWPVDRKLESILTGEPFISAARRGKYLLLQTQSGCLIIHLGMSGSLRITDQKAAYEKHDHFEIVFKDLGSLRLKDPRRFGAVLWTEEPACEHKLLKHLGPEPLSDEFNDEHLFRLSRKKKTISKAVYYGQPNCGRCGKYICF